MQPTSLFRSVEDMDELDQVLLSCAKVSQERYARQISFQSKLSMTDFICHTSKLPTYLIWIAITTSAILLRCIALLQRRSLFALLRPPGAGPAPNRVFAARRPRNLHAAHDKPGRENLRADPSGFHAGLCSECESGIQLNLANKFLLHILILFLPT